MKLESNGVDCLVIGHNEVPFVEYERRLSRYGKESVAYRELRLNFVDLHGVPTTYLDLLNWCEEQDREALSGVARHRRYLSGDIPNLAAVYLTSYLNRKGHSARYVNLYQEEEARLGALLDQNPMCVAVTTTLYVTNDPASEVVRAIKAMRPDIPVVIGGPLISNHVRRFSRSELEVVLDDLGADIYVVDSQGELTLSRIVECLKSKGSLQSVGNLIYKSGDAFHHTPVVPEANSLDENYIDWGTVLAPSENPTIQTRTARSCAFQCAFCAYPTRAGKLTLADLSTVKKELDSMLELGGVENVVFVDDTFNVPVGRFKDFCRLVIEREYPFRFFSYFRCSNADEEAIDLMARAGWAGVFLGIESGSEEILRNMNKAANVEQYRVGVERLKRHDILTFGSFLFGFPGETDETVRDTIDFIREIGPDFYRVQPWYYEAGTPIEARRRELDLVGAGFSWKHRTMSAPVAMNHVEAAFKEIRESRWLPQWSFDFWIIPYLMGRGVRVHAFRDWVTEAQGVLLAGLEAPDTSGVQERREDGLRRMVQAAKRWRRPSGKSARRDSGGGPPESDARK